MAKNKDVCIVPGCENKRFSRGLCQGCYDKARRMIRNAEMTDEEMVEKKLILPTSVSGRKPAKSPFHEAVEKARTRR